MEMRDPGGIAPSPNYSERVTPITPAAGGVAYVVLESGLAEEVQEVARVSIGGTTYKASPVAAGPIALDVDAPTGGSLQVIQADSLGDLTAGRVSTQVYTYEAGKPARKVEGIVPIRRFVVLAFKGDGGSITPRPLGAISRGPSRWTLAPGVVAWGGVQ